ncbi:bifunctional diguanylate cyclase/phosphodiesterase [Ideonella sp. A 288]|uniref:putative bifunctional diguanylate cyclase/phosphodiesterase n=1 Tax=Ideonella sp. A 288 TaxID=1962181 RepID=UPI000B4ADA15|nr:GGDEF and EAL domain-containing protein [Ideonella sp. A 288]
MTFVDAAQFRSLRSAVADMYGNGDRDAALLRGAHLREVVRLTPYALACHMGSAVLVVWSFTPGAPPGLWLWLAVLLVLSGLGLRAWWRQARRPRDTVSVRAVHRATLHAAFLAGLWTVPLLLWFPTAAPAQQMVVATLVTGMIGAGSFMLSTLPLASMAYVGVFSLSALGALWRAGDPDLAALAALIGLYSPMVVIGSLSAWGKATALIRAQARSAQQERTLAVLLHDFEQHADEALWEVGVDGRLRHLSPRLAELLGVGEDDIRAGTLLALLEPRAHDGLAALRLAFDAGRPFRNLQLTLRTDAAPRHLAINGKRLVDDEGQTLGWRGVLADVTEKLEGERQLRRLAHTDSLTGLANRFMLRDALAEVVHGDRSAALLLIDLDHFKTVNDSMGHSAGDDVLKAVAQRLRACVRPDDLVARLGGDEFAVLMRHVGEAPDAATMAQRLVDALSLPVELSSRRLRVGASVGVAASDDATLGVDEWLARSDTALYAAKESGRGRFAVYAPHLGERSRRRLAIEQGLRQALERGQLALHWQPKVDIADWRIAGAEALMRWEHPVLGRVPPGEFIGVAEQCGLIDELGRWALREACRAAAGPLAGLTVSVNVSPLQLRESQFVAQVRDTLRECRLPPSRLELEITESVFIDDADGALEKLHTLRGLGVRVALDDFGTGYSSLAYLRRFPFDTLKIDRAFVSEVLVQPDARAIVQMISHLATTLGMRTVCEGVESALQLEAVARAGCHEMQGYLVSPAVPLPEFLRLQRGWQHESSVLSAVH